MSSIKDVIILISYEKLWKTMRERGITQYALIKKYGISPGQITRLKRNESVSTHTIDLFCGILGCDVGDVMQHIPDENRGYKKQEAHQV